MMRANMRAAPRGGHFVIRLKMQPVVDVRLHQQFNPSFPLSCGVAFPCQKQRPDANVITTHLLVTVWKQKQPVITTRPLSHVHTHYLTFGTSLPLVLRPRLDLARTIFVMVLRSRN